jgi:radical SAM/Cys-rich protein
MNTFDKKLSEQGLFPLAAENISTLQVNIGYRCNLRCTHCHVEASPDRIEEMPLSTLSKVLDILKEHDGITTVDITGGSPELNLYFKYFVNACVDREKNVIVRTNLSIYSEPGMEGLPEVLTDNKVKLVASLPCYTEEGVDSQRGKGTYKKAMAALKKLNSLGYGREGSGLKIDIMFNPAGAGIAPDQNTLEKAYMDKLAGQGITFNHLIALSNMPIGRLGNTMSDSEKQEYMKQLKHKYNPETVEKLMCRHLISVAPDGTLYDCDFWQMLKLPIKNRRSNDVKSFDYDALKNREILTASLCFMCTAGAGAGCSGALT